MTKEELLKISSDDYAEHEKRDVHELYSMGSLGGRAARSLRRAFLTNKIDVWWYIVDYREHHDKNDYAYDNPLKTIPGLGVKSQQIVEKWLNEEVYIEPKKSISEIKRRIHWYETRIATLKKEYGIK